MNESGRVDYREGAGDVGEQRPDRPWILPATCIAAAAGDPLRDEERRTGRDVVEWLRGPADVEHTWQRWMAQSREELELVEQERTLGADLEGARLGGLSIDDLEHSAKCPTPDQLDDPKPSEQQRVAGKGSHHLPMTTKLAAGVNMIG